MIKTTLESAAPAIPNSANYCFGEIDTPFGKIILGTDESSVILCTIVADTVELDDCTPKRATASNRAANYFAKASAALRRHVDGERAPFREIAVAQHGSSFQQAVWGVLREIPFGTTLTYAEVAQRTQSPRAIRAVGRACGANEVLLFVPCHRVVRSGMKSLEQRLGGFGAGIERKRALLQHEGLL